MTKIPPGVEAYPLSWPAGRPRSKSRARARFSSVSKNRSSSSDSLSLVWNQRSELSVAQSLSRLRHELGLMKASYVVISTNVPLRLDGLPLSSARAPDDPGAAVYFQLDGSPHCMACDRWDRTADNLAAVAKHVEAIRGQLRWGVADVAQMFAGFRALPGPAAGRRSCWEVLGVDAGSPASRIKERYRELAMRHHPDRGGSQEQMAEISSAYTEALLGVSR